MNCLCLGHFRANYGVQVSIQHVQHRIPELYPFDIPVLTVKYLLGVPAIEIMPNPVKNVFNTDNAVEKNLKIIHNERLFKNLRAGIKNSRARGFIIEGRQARTFKSKARENF